MELPREWAQLDAQQLRDLTATLFERLQHQETQLIEQQVQLPRRDEELKRRQLMLANITISTNVGTEFQNFEHRMPC